MKLLHRYAQPKRANEVQTVIVAGPHHAAYKGKVYDLRTATTVRPSKAAGFANDGSHVEWNKAGALILVEPDGTSRPLHGYEGLSSQLMLVGAEVVLMQADARQPPLCIDRATGQPTGRLEGLLGEPFGQVHLFHPSVFALDDGRSVWLGDGGRLALVDLGTRRVVRAFDPPADEKYAAPAVHESGVVLTIARKKAHGFDTSHDELVLLSAEGVVLRRERRTVMSYTALTRGFVAFEPSQKQFVVFDPELNELERIPHDQNWVRLVALPSRREWLSIGGRGEWDHHGEDELGPGAAAPLAPAPRKKKPAAKKKT